MTEYLLDPLRHLLEQFIAGRVAERIVDLLEAVEVKQHDRAAALGLSKGRESLSEQPRHAVAVGKPGQLVILRHTL